MPEYHIYIGADHRGFQKKEELFDLIKDCHENVIVEDLGADSLNPDDDFNDPAIAVGVAVRQNEHNLGVLICGSAHGVTMQANRLKGVRAINADTEQSAIAGREDDHANVLCLSGDQLDVETMEKIVKAFCHAHPKQDKRYVRRVKRLDEELAKPTKFSLQHDAEDDDEEE